MNNILSQTKKQQILELYLCGNDPRLKTISECVNSTDNTVSKVIQSYFDKEIEFERGNYQILHSSINNF